MLSETPTEPLWLYTMAPNGSNVRVVVVPIEAGLDLFPPAWSPDGERLAFIAPTGSMVGRRSDDNLGYLYTVRADGKGLTRIDKTTALPSWSPDGKELAFANQDDEGSAVYAAQPDGAGPRTVWRSEAGETRPPVMRVVWSPDGSALLFVSDGIDIIHPDGTGLRRLVDPEIGQGALAAWSPDGSRIAVYNPCAGRYGAREYLSIHFCRTTASEVLTIASDGTDLRVLATGVSHGKIYAVNHPPPVDLGVCSAGEVVPEPEANPGLVRDCETLLSVRDALAGTAAGSARLHWYDDTPIDRWPGVGVEGLPLRVRSLEMHFELTGILPPELSRLSELSIINLYSRNDSPIANRLTGSMPPEWGQLTKLVRLDLSRNALSGPIPPELGRLSRLEGLYLGGNQLSGPIPPELDGLDNLQVLDLAGNQLSGEIPPELGSLPKLAVLWLFRNQLSGEIPPKLGKLQRLTHLNLSRNQLVGSIPAELGKLLRLGHLDLSDNRLAGSIPAELVGAVALNSVRIAGNNLSGCVPEGLRGIWVQQSGLERCAATPLVSP